MRIAYTRSGRNRTPRRERGIVRSAGTLAPERKSLTAAPSAVARVRLRAWPLAVAGLVIGAVLLRLPYLNVPISADEGGYATAAYWWARGDTLYQQITITRPQGIFVVFRLIQALGLGSVQGIHFVAAAWVALSTLTLLALAARVWGARHRPGRRRWLRGGDGDPWMEGYSANAELFMTLPLLASLLALLRADDYELADRRGSALLIASGLL